MRIGRGCKRVDRGFKRVGRGSAWEGGGCDVLGQRQNYSDIVRAMLFQLSLFFQPISRPAKKFGVTDLSSDGRMNGWTDGQALSY